MEEKVMKITAGMLLGLTIVFSVLYTKLPQVQAWAMAQIKNPAEEQQNMNTLALNDTEIVDEENHMQLRMTLPEGVTGEQVQVRTDHVMLR